MWKDWSTSWENNCKMLRTTKITKTCQTLRQRFGMCSIRRNISAQKPIQCVASSTQGASKNYTLFAVLEKETPKNISKFHFNMIHACTVSSLARKRHSESWVDSWKLSQKKQFECLTASCSMLRDRRRKMPGCQDVVWYTRDDKVFTSCRAEGGTGGNSCNRQAQKLHDKVKVLLHVKTPDWITVGQDSMTDLRS